MDGEGLLAAQQQPPEPPRISLTLIRAAVLVDRSERR